MALRALAAALLCLQLVGPASALDLEVHPVADGYRTGYWTPIRVVVSTDADPFEGDVVLRLGASQVHRVPMSLAAHARREVVVGVIPFRPTERLEAKAADRVVVIDLRMAAGPLIAAEASLLDAARREHGPQVAELGDKDPALWEGFDEVLVSGETSERRLRLHLGAGQAWVRPQFRACGVVWTTSEAVRHGIPSVQGAWMRELPVAPWGPRARRRFLLMLAAFLAALVGGLGFTARRGAWARTLTLGAIVAATTIAAATSPAPGLAVSAVSITGPRTESGWQARGVGCAARGSAGDVEIELPGVPRPLFGDLEKAQTAPWGVVWAERRRLVFPARPAGSSCWFEWKTGAAIAGRVVALRDGRAANEMPYPLSPAVLAVDGRLTYRATLREGEATSPATSESPPPQFRLALLSAIDPGWKRGRHLLGGLPTPVHGLGDVDLVDGQSWIWVPLE